MSTRILKHFLKCSFVQFHIIFDMLIDLIFGLYYKNDIQKVPPIKNNLVLMSASELAEKIRYLINFTFDIIFLYNINFAILFIQYMLLYIQYMKFNCMKYKL